METSSFESVKVWGDPIAYHRYSYSLDILNKSQLEVKLG
jgi:hypothetical protein